MICGPDFPFPKPDFGVPEQTFFAVIRTQEIFDLVLSHLCYTDRASLSQSCPEATVGVSNSQTVWFVNDEDFGDAEFHEEEFRHIVEANEVWDVTAPRGAKVASSFPVCLISFEADFCAIRSSWSQCMPASISHPTDIDLSQHTWRSRLACFGSCAPWTTLDVSLSALS